MSSTKPPDDNANQESNRSLWHILHEESTEVSPPATKPAPGSEEVTEGETSQREVTPDDFIPQESSPVEPVSQDVAQLERILYDPTFDEEAVALPETQAAEADYDSAVLNYYRDAHIAVKCRNHPEDDAWAQCPECQAYFCQQCLVVRRGRLVCRDCAVALHVPSEEEVIAAQIRGEAEPSAEISLEEHPEFEISGRQFGLEGRPSHPLKRLMALLIDLLITRSALLALVFILGAIFGSTPSPVFHLFDNVPGENTTNRIFEAIILLRPYVPWLIIFAIVDYLYFFFSLSLFNRTLGMSWLGCRIVTEWGDYASFGVVALRTLVFMVCLGWPAIILGWFFPGYRGPHDYAAGTLVINYAGVKRIDAYETVQIKL